MLSHRSTNTHNTHTRPTKHPHGPAPRFLPLLENNIHRISTRPGGGVRETTSTNAHTHTHTHTHTQKDEMALKRSSSESPPPTQQAEAALEHPGRPLPTTPCSQAPRNRSKRLLYTTTLTLSNQSTRTRMAFVAHAISGVGDVSSQHHAAGSCRPPQNSVIFANFAVMVFLAKL